MTPHGVPFYDLIRRTPVAEMQRIAASVIATGRFVGGPEVELFEEEFAAYCGTRHCVGVSSGMTALQAALLAFGIGPRTEVVTASATFEATAAAIAHTGATPVFVDIDPVSHTLDPQRLEEAITSRTEAIVPVDLYGCPADMRAIREIADRHGLVVVADAAQAHGARVAKARVGSLAHATAFSFYPSKNLGACGDAGAVTTDDASVARAVRELRNHGRADRDTHACIGHNWRLDALQAAVLRSKLRLLDAHNTLRRETAARYRSLLADTGLRLPSERPGTDHAYHLYVVRTDRRNELRKGLADRNVETRIHYPRAVHQLPPFRQYAPAGRSLTITEALADECLSLPMFPGITDEETARVAEAVHDVLALPPRARRPHPSHEQLRR